MFRLSYTVENEYSEDLYLYQIRNPLLKKYDVNLMEILTTKETSYYDLKSSKDILLINCYQFKRNYIAEFGESVYISRYLLRNSRSKKFHAGFRIDKNTYHEYLYSTHHSEVFLDRFIIKKVLDDFRREELNQCNSYYIDFSIENLYESIGGADITYEDILTEFINCSNPFSKQFISLCIKSKIHYYKNQNNLINLKERIEKNVY